MIGHSRQYEVQAPRTDELIEIQMKDMPTHNALDVVDVDLLVVSELERALALVLAEGLGLVDLGIFWQLTVRFHWRQTGQQRPAGDRWRTHSYEPRLPCT